MNVSINGTYMDVKKIVYDVAEYISNIQRPTVKAPDESGRMRILNT